MISAEQLLVIANKHLRELKLHWSLIGGMAVSARSEPRFTRDLDVAVSVVSDDEAEEVVRKMRERGMTVMTRGKDLESELERLCKLYTFTP